MLLHPLYGILAVLPFVALCSGSGSNDTSNAALWNIIPDCAQKCVENFILGEYTSDECSSALDIKCLCRTKTPIGLTLGEAALSCLYALCDENYISSKGNSVYHVCDSVSGAIRETHSVITATTFDPPSSTTTTAGATASVGTASGSTSQNKPGSSTSSLPTSTTSVSYTSDSSITYQTTSSGSGVIPAATGTETTSDTLSTDTSSPSNDGTAKNHISSGTVIGVSVASGVAGSFIIGVAVFLCCKRWKQRNHTIGSDSDNDFFEIGGAMSQPPGFSRPSSRRSSPSPGPTPAGPSSFSHTRGHQEVSELPCTRTPTAQNPPTTATVMLVPNAEKPREIEPIGVAVSSGDEWETSPRTLSSQNTLAEPMVPQSVGLYPKPLKWSHRPVSGETLFEEDEFQQPQPSQSNSSQKSESPRIMAGLPANPRALKNGFPAQKYLRPPQQLPYPGQSPSILSAQGVSTEITLAPAFSTTARRGSPPSNSSGTPHNSSGSSHRYSANTTLTTPFSTGQGRILGDMSPGRPSPAQGPSPRPSPKQAATQSGRLIPGPGPATPAPPSNGLGLSPAAEIVSRPRIVRRDDIKRVQIRSSPRPPSEVVVPYCPEDFWLERGRSRAPASTGSGGLPYPSEAFPGAVLYPRSPQKRPQDINAQRLSATGRSLTPSRRGQDLILRVD
ncbi:uncharacterized protein N7458_010733 [Penicillium daleae]|uniref:CFEM domain-containing protein n=1 Tax=Penicillium daleae TaxID=63821 RepID=A0AAD6FZM1_9EURO|nr:uncharacterized protein N7458_010733 [Penicillium daleae]KAJ5439735.1 hypothetical protein N7458_010733 [Penicillium daleae]